jgi:YVTN family beta-propeller protein
METRVGRRWAVIAGLGVGLVLALRMAPGPRVATGEAPRILIGPQPDGAVVVPTNQVLHPAGKQITFPGRPNDLALSADGKSLAVLVHDAVLRIDLEHGAVAERVRAPNKGNSFAGIAYAPSGDRLYAAATTGGILRLGVDGAGRWTALEPIPTPREGTNPMPLPGGMAFTPDGQTLLVALSRDNALGRVDLATRQITRRIPVGVAPYGVVLSADGRRAYVSNWGGRRPRPADATAPSAGTETVADAKTGVASSGTVSEVDLETGTVARELVVGLHPCALALSRDGRLLFVANANSDTVSVVDTASGKAVETISVRPDERLPFGSAPNALALSADGDTLYVANGGNNAVAVIRLGRTSGGARARSELTGLIPTGWYPGALALSRDGRRLYVANVKGHGALAQRPGRKGHNSHDHLGSLSIIDLPDEATLARWTAQVARDNGMRDVLAARQSGERGAVPLPVPRRVGEPSVFKHVIYVIKENRTYDQILGDLGRGNGDASLCQFGREVTPNQHALAEEFATLDNFYCSGVLSADGHQWTDEAYVTDYLEKSFGGWPRSYPYEGDDPLAFAGSGFLWDNVLRHGLTFRDYGEMVHAQITPRTATWSDIWQDFKNGEGKVRIEARTEVLGLRPYIHPRCVGFPLVVSDQYRLEQFLKEFAAWEKDGKLPSLVMMLLPSNHTSGTRPGLPTPRAAVADNDLAVGRLVEAVSRSRYWKDTVIFTVEDDAQAGTDHVDGHRTVAFAISAYTRRGAVVSSLYNHTSMVRTIEQILGLPPMNQFDGAAALMTDCFTEKPDLTPYRARPNQIALDEINPPMAALRGPALHWARLSMRQDFSGLDRADEDTLNRIIWHATKGYDQPYPRVRGARREADGD